MCTNALPIMSLIVGTGVIDFGVGLVTVTTSSKGFELAFNSAIFCLRSFWYTPKYGIF